MKQCSKPMARAAARWAWVVSLVASLLLPTASQAQAETGYNQRLERIERALENKGLLDLVRQIDLLKAEVRQLRGELENQIFAVEQQRKSQVAAYSDVDRRVMQLEQSGTMLSQASTPRPGNDALLPLNGRDPPLPTLASIGDSQVAGTPSEHTIDIRTPSELRAPTTVDQASGDGTTFAPPAAAVIAREVPANPPGAKIVNAPAVRAVASRPTIDSAASEAAYRDAFAMLKAGQYPESIGAFNGYLQQFPASQHADNAQYWLGEAYYVMRQFEPAIEQYQKLVQNFPDSQKQSHALLKIGYSYDKLGLGAQAISVLRDLKTRFAGSAAARLADERMQRMRSAAP